MSGRIAWKRRSRPAFAVPPADSPSTRNSSQRSGSLLLAIGQLARQAAGIERAFAARQIAGLAGRFARARRVDRLADDLLHHRRILVEELAQLLVDELRHVALDIAVQLALGLAFELRLRQLHADHRGQAFADVVAGEVLFDVLEQAGLLAARR